MINLTLKQMRYFEALAQEGHFGRAAQSCSISQPALSVQIREMEDTLGSPLFERNARQVRLTGFGEEMSLRIREILRLVEDLGEMARSRKDRIAGRLRIGVIPTIAPYLLPGLIGHLRDTFPELDIHIRETLTPKLLEELDDGKIDTAILALPIDMDAFVERPIFTENFLLIRTDAEADSPPPTMDELQDMQLLLLEEGHCFRDQALSFCNISPMAQKGGLDGSSLSTLVQMVGAGLGVTLIPEMAQDIETRSAPVSITRFPDPQPQRTIGMIWRRSSPLSDQLGEIAQEIHALHQAS